jgi:hypothetical protein
MGRKPSASRGKSARFAMSRFMRRSESLSTAIVHPEEQQTPELLHAYCVWNASASTRRLVATS